MIKKFIIAVLSFVVAVQPCIASAKDYYIQREFDKIDARELIYEKADISDAKKSVENLPKLLQGKDNDLEVMLIIGQCYDNYSNTYNEYYLASLAASREGTEKNLANLRESTEINMEALSLLSSAVKQVYNSDYKTVLEYIFGEEAAEIYIQSMPDDETIELTNRELELSERYTEIWEDSDACAQLFIELMEIRNTLAKKAGYENYAEYANREIYGREYSQDELDEFYASVREHIVPIFYESVIALENIERPLVPMTRDEVLLNARNIVGNINPELKTGFDYMIANNLYDIFPEENKRETGGYTTNLPSVGVPFIYINPDVDPKTDGIPLMQTLIHEFGHFSAMLNDPIVYENGYDLFYAVSNETAETQSQGLEMLSEEYYGKVLGSAAAYARYDNIFSLSAAVIDGCFFNEWQTNVYLMENVTVDMLNEEAQRLFGLYYGFEYHEEDAQGLWTAVMHNFTAPMYYISYALSGIQALNLYDISTRDYSEAVDIYMQTSAKGIYVPFAEITEISGVSGVCDDEAIERIADGINKAYALSYTDVINGDWYVPYLYKVSNIFEGRAENTFMPEAYITRSEFVSVLGKMYDYYSGIDGEYEYAFKDVEQNENSMYIGWAVHSDIINGYDNETFGGNDPLTREEAATIIYRLSEDTSSEIYAQSFLDYAQISDWAKSAVSWAIGCGIINGRGNNDFDPSAGITRAETAKIVSCYIDSMY